jgi:hypothetical protein
MSVTRQSLYEQVWAEPVTAVSTRYGVSPNYLARVCEHLNVPRPPRGYWAKVQAGQSPRRSPLPDARPGEVLSWEQGQGVPRPSRTEVARTPGLETAGKEMPSRHPLVVAVKEHFEAGRLSEVGYLRPRKHNLVDVFVSRPALSSALEAASRLFLLLEAKGYRVALASGADRLHRPELAVFDGQKFDYHNREPWAPWRETIAFVGDVQFGLTVYELTESVEVTYEWDRPVRYVRVPEAAAKTKSRWSLPIHTTKEHMPSGLLAVRAYSPYYGARWERCWKEQKAATLHEQFPAIAKTLKAAAPEVSRLREEARRRAEAERQRWAEESARRQREEAERRRARALEESRARLLETVRAWSLARDVELFFRGIEEGVAARPADERRVLRERLEVGRRLLGGTDPLARFLEWQLPEDLEGVDDDDVSGEEP